MISCGPWQTSNAIIDKAGWQHSVISPYSPDECAWINALPHLLFWSASQNAHIDLQNIFPVTRRGCCGVLGNYIAQKFKKIWGKEGMESKEKFGELLKELYHPHARFDSPQNHDIVGHMEIESLYDSFVLGNRK